MSFEQAVFNWAKKAGDNIDRIYRASIRDVIEASTVEVPGLAEGGSFQEGKVPVVTRELADSLFVEINGARKSGANGAYRRVIDSVKAEDDVRYGWAAPHARKINYGDGLLPGRFFAEKGFNRWRTSVNKNAARFSK